MDLHKEDFAGIMLNLLLQLSCATFALITVNILNLNLLKYKCNCAVVVTL